MDRDKDPTGNTVSAGPLKGLTGLASTSSVVRHQPPVTQDLQSRFQQK